MKYTVFIERSAQKSLSKIPNPHRDRIVQAISKLKNNPRPAGVKKLTGREAWRMRVGVYRIIFEIEDKVLKVLVISIGHRKEIYRD